MKFVKISVALAALTLLFSQAAFAQTFDVSVSFELSDTKVGANPALKIHMEQPAGQPEMGHVTLTVPKGFKIPGDAKIENGDQLGVADLSINAGPGCAGGAGSAPATFPDRRIVEQDRTDEQADRGVRAVWLVDLKPVTSIPLEVTGSPKRGYKLDGDIPANQFTCPPIVFDAEIGPKSAAGVPVLKNTLIPGNYAFKAIFTTQDAPDVDINKQIIKITP